VFYFTSKPFQPKAGLPRGGGVKKKHFTCEATGGIQTWDFWSAVKCFNHLVTGHLNTHLMHQLHVGGMGAGPKEKLNFRSFLGAILE